MPRIVIVTATNRAAPVQNPFATLAAANTAAAANTEWGVHATDFNTDDIPVGLAEGWYVSPDGSTITRDEPETDAQQKAAIVTLGKEWMLDALDNMKAVWTMPWRSSTTPVLNARWLNTWFWICSPALIIKTVSTNTNWTLADLQLAWEVYQRLVPAGNPRQIRHWYLNHTSSTWANYRSTVGKAHFAWGRGNTIVPNFASDAGSALSWDDSDAAAARPDVPFPETFAPETL